MVAMFDSAFKQQPQSEELGAQTFFAHVRTGNWKSCQQVSIPNTPFFCSQTESCGPRGCKPNAQAVPGGPVHLLGRHRRNSSGSYTGDPVTKKYILITGESGERSWHSSKYSQSALQTGSPTCHIMSNAIVHGRGSLPLASDHPAGTST